MKTIRTLRIVLTSKGFEETMRFLAHFARALQLLVIFHRRAIRQIIRLTSEHAREEPTINVWKSLWE